MNEKSRLVIIVVVAMAIILAVTAFAYNRHKKYVAEQAIGGPYTVTAPTTQPKEVIYDFDDILDSIELLGKSMDSLGIDKKYFKESVSTQFDCTGKFFGTDADGTLFFSDENENGEKVSNTAYISIHSSDYDTAVENLKTLYGEPTNSGEEPFARANGGAVLWTDFENENYKIELSSASERDYIELTVKLK